MMSNNDDHTTGMSGFSASLFLQSFVVVLVLHGVITLFHLLLPAFVVEGYVCHVLSVERQPLVYRLNGLGCLLITISLVFIFQLDITFLSYNYLYCALVSNCIGLLASFYMVYIRFPALSVAEQDANAVRRAPTLQTSSSSSSSGSSTRASNNNKSKMTRDDRTPAFYWGREFTPRYNYFGDNNNHNHYWDIKMWLYVVGAVVLELLVVAALQRERLERGNKSNSMALLTYASLMAWFGIEYLYFERIHLYTYDLFAEKVGFKLVWGCLCFYPFFYVIGMLPIVMSANEENADISMPQAAAAILLYLCGWILTRGANLQKYTFRRFPKEKKCSLFGGALVLEQRTLDSCDAILCSGFWGLARHVNYAGEILQAVAVAIPGCCLSAGVPLQWRLLPLAYPLYYILLFIPRERDDEKVMRQKYGDLIMDEYIRKVPYRMVPGLY